MRRERHRVSIGAALSLFAITFLCSAGAPVVGETWSELDREIDALHTRLSAESNGPQIGGFLRIRGAASNNADIDPAPGDQHLSGFTLDNVRVEIQGTPREGWSYFVSLDAGHQAELDTFAGPGVDLIDAYATARLCPGATFTMGQFCSNFLWSACNRERNLLFLDRSFLGENWDGRDVGAQIAGTYGPLDAWVAVQDGFDGKVDHQAFTARAAYRAWGEGGWCCEGSCFGGGERLTIGAAVFEDRSMDQGSATGVDALFVHGRFSAHAEVVRYGRDMRPMPELDLATGAIVPGMMDPNGSDTPWDATVGYAFVPDVWEVAVRGQALDDADDTSILSLALDRWRLGAGFLPLTAPRDDFNGRENGKLIQSVAGH
jgi:hypothetical protein